MSAILSQHTVGGLVAERPSRARVFERWGIDYCCGGKQRLEDACAQKLIALEVLLRELQEEAAEEGDDQSDWTTARLSALIEHIVTTHHAYLREALPRLSLLIGKVRDAHATRHPELDELARVFAAFRADMEAHTQKEEGILFPYISRLEQAETLPLFHCASVRNPI